MKWIHILCACFILPMLNAQTSGKHVLQFFSKNDSYAIPFTILQATYQNQIVGKWVADLDGIIILDSLNYNPQTKFIASETGFESLTFGLSDIKPRDTIKFYLPDRFYMNTLVITANKYPLKEASNQKTIDSIAWYNQVYQSTVDSLKSGLWFTASQQKLTLSYLQYLKITPGLISYPETARRYGVEETVYFSFDLDAKGYISDLKLEKSNNSIFAIRASRIMATLLRIVSDLDSKIQLKENQKVRVIQPIEFQLK